MEAPLGCLVREISVSRRGNSSRISLHEPLHQTEAPPFTVALGARAEVVSLVRKATTRGHHYTTKLIETHVELFMPTLKNGVGAGESAVRSQRCTVRTEC